MRVLLIIQTWNPSFESAQPAVTSQVIENITRESAAQLEADLQRRFSTRSDMDFILVRFE